MALRVNSNTGDVTISADAVVSVTGSRINLIIGNADVAANAVVSGMTEQIYLLEQ